MGECASFTPILRTGLGGHRGSQLAQTKPLTLSTVGPPRAITKLTTSVSKLAVSVAVLAALTACSSNSSRTEATPSVFEVAIVDARAGGASEAQIALLERLAEVGNVEIDDVREALEGTYACLDAAGILHTEEIQSDASGLEYVVYFMQTPVSADQEAAVAISDECTNANSRYVEDLYHEQPRAVALEDKYMETVVVPAFIECDKSYGVPVDEDATGAQRWDDAMAVVAASPGVKPGDPTHAGCVYGVLVHMG